jgi:xylitol oxidase
MDKRTFLKTSSALTIGGVLLPLASCGPEERPAAPRTNWAGNLTYSAERLHEPQTIEEVQDIIRSSEKIRALGSRHCFNPIADSPVSQISLRHLNHIGAIDEAARQVTVEAGVRYGELGPYLHEQGYAVHNLASLPHISVAGACATATHGSGIANGNLATAVAAIELVRADGEQLTLTREDPDFAGAVVGLGALGVVTRLTLNLVPTFAMRQHVYQYLPLAELETHFDEIMGSAYSVSLFTDWQSETVNQVWIKRVDDEEPFVAAPEFYGARLADRKVHPILELSAESCTEQMGEVGPWYDRLPHFKLEFTPSSGTELQSEYFVPRANAWEVMRLFQDMGDQLGSLLMISEIRTIASDDYWMSTAYGRESVAFHCTWEQDWEALQALLPVIERALEPYGARPHWGKNFTMQPGTLQSRYQKLPEFKALLEAYDPGGKFRNPFIDEHLYTV